MEVVTKKRLHIVSGRANLPLAQEIAGCLDVRLGEPNCTEFANGEIHCRFSESVRGMDVFICSSDKDCRQLLSDQIKVFNLRKQEVFDRASLEKDFSTLS